MKAGLISAIPSNNEKKYYEQVQVEVCLDRPPVIAACFASKYENLLSSQLIRCFQNTQTEY